MPPDSALPAAQRDALLAELNALLEAERAGARVALETGRALDEPRMAELVEHIRLDEVRWCGMLLRAIRALGATPSDLTGAFHGKAMAIADIEQRLVLLNRGQGWVVRKLQDLLQRPLPDFLRADLADMLAAHESNIGLVKAALPPQAP
ncbi:DUF6306 domain-containing protein [Bordetella petrii]|uniref:DUF6306 domain-containing protein n=1 Tax=Bordetella petrii TaxID=94624 RepID=UPI001A97CD20|nr:DUF6306 domain-containing protein [Bordetella petrii]MBO1111159.1 2-nitropropane dioxygenase [Bordetella petrii]